MINYLPFLLRKAKKGVAEFFGIAADMEKKNLRWENRRTRVASKTGKGLKDGYKSGAASMDAVDGPPNIIDPLNRGASRQMSHMSATSGMTQMGANNRKKSVMQMAMEGVTSLSVSFHVFLSSFEDMICLSFFLLLKQKKLGRDLDMLVDIIWIF